MISKSPGAKRSHEYGIKLSHRTHVIMKKIYKSFLKFWEIPGKKEISYF
jgi:hypothetical protein